MGGPRRRVYPFWIGASPQRRELPVHYELALRNPGGDCGRVLRLDVEEDRLDPSLRASPRRRGHLLALLLPHGLIRSKRWLLQCKKHLAKRRKRLRARGNVHAAEKTGEWCAPLSCWLGYPQVSWIHATMTGLNSAREPYAADAGDHRILTDRERGERVRQRASPRSDRRRRRCPAAA